MKRTFSYKITTDNAGQSIEKYLRKQGFSGQNITELKKMPESILVNGVWEHVNYLLNPSDTLTIHIEEIESSPKIIPVELPLDIVYEDEDLLVVNKPADMPIHPSLKNYENTLANAVSYYYQKQGVPFVFRCINRLDRDTTGLTIIAKHMVSANILSQMVAERKIHREYLAIVEDNNLEDTGTINAPIARKDGSTIERMVDFTKGERAVTHYQVIRRGNGYALVSLRLETGRTHQIRVHMAYTNCPLVGDGIYNPKDISYFSAITDKKDVCDSVGDICLLERQALHSARLELFHPITKELLCFTQKLPDDMEIFLKRYFS